MKIIDHIAYLFSGNKAPSSAPKRISAFEYASATMKDAQSVMQEMGDIIREQSATISSQRKTIDELKLEIDHLHNALMEDDDL